MKSLVFQPLRLVSGGAVLLALGLFLPWPDAGPAGFHTLVSRTLHFAPSTGAGGVLGQSDWLDPGDSRDPADWLAAAEEGAGSVLQSSRIAPLLDRADQRFDESARMIANRIAQVRAEFPDLRAERLLDDLLTPDGDDRAFGVVVQHYLVLRRSGLDHAGAVAAIFATSSSAGPEGVE